MEKDNYGRGPQTTTSRTLQLFVEVYQMIGEYPFAEIGKKIKEEWISFTTHNVDPEDIDEELNVFNKDHSISYNVIAIKS